MDDILTRRRERIREFIEEQKNDWIIDELKDLHEADIAELFETLKKDERTYVFNLLETEEKALVITELEEGTRETLIAALDNSTIVDIIEEVDSDEAADIVQYLPEEQQEEILDSVDQDVAEDVQELIHFAEDTAGGIMRLEYIDVNENIPVSQAREKVKQLSTDWEMENIYNVWVVDDKGILRGYVSLQNLITADENILIKSIANEEIRSVYPDIDQEEVAKLAIKYSLVAVPVVDYSERLIGIVSFNNIVDVIGEEADEDISKLSGSGDITPSEESSLRITRARMPWLLVALFGELISAFVIFQFAADLQKAVALSFFFPVIMAMGGNVGIQASAIIVRGLATGEISSFAIRSRLLRELRASLLIGVMCACILFTIITFWLKDYRMGLTVAIALFIVVSNAATIGTLMPFVLNRMKIDPAVSTGPFITTSNDIFGLLIYLLIVTSFL